MVIDNIVRMRAKCDCKDMKWDIGAVGALCPYCRQTIRDPLKKAKVDIRFKDKKFFIKRQSHVGTHKLMSEIFDSFKKRINIYERYCNNRNLLKEEHPDIFDIWLCTDYYNKIRKIHNDHQIQLIFKDWLFKFCFEGV